MSNNAPMNSRIIPEYVKKEKGIQEICFVFETGQVALVLTIELSEYFGEEVFEEVKEEKGLEKVILLNMYHLESVLQDKREEKYQNDIRIVISPD